MASITVVERQLFEPSDLFRLADLLKSFGHPMVSRQSDRVKIGGTQKKRTHQGHWPWGMEIHEDDVAAIFCFTPPKFNMEPANKSLEKESPFGNHFYQVPCEISGV